MNFICKNKVWKIMLSICTTFIKSLIPSHLVDNLGLCTTVSRSLDTTPGFIGRYIWTIFIFNATRLLEFIYQIFISYFGRDWFYEFENGLLFNLVLYIENYVWYEHWLFFLLLKALYHITCKEIGFTTYMYGNYV